MESKINFGKFDMYSKRIGFYYNKQEKIGSFLGVFLTFFYILASIILFIYEIIMTIKRSNLTVYDTNIYAQEMPIIDADINQLYFAFGLEDPKTSNRFIDERIYTAKVAFIDKIKINDKFETISTTNLPIERCKVENFGKNYQHLFTKDEFSNSYCLKDFNYSLKFAGGYKYEKFTYIRLRIYPCVNSTSNNYSCEPQEKIDEFLTSGYFSIVIKDFGLNPSNYSFPVLPTFQDLYTTIDKKIYRNYILSFGVTEVHTDTGLITENIKIDRYLQYRKEVQTFSFRDEADYYAGRSIILVQLRLDDTIHIQARSYTKIVEIFSRMGGYMQLMNTIFLLISSIVNNLNAELRILNSIFKFNIKENKMILKIQSLKDFNIVNNTKNVKKFPFSQEIKIFNLKENECENKSKNNLIIKDNNILNISSLNYSENKNNNKNEKNIIKINKKGDTNNFEDSKNDYTKSSSFHKNKNSEKIIHYKRDLQKYIFDFYNKEETNKDFNDHININIFDYFCLRKIKKNNTYINLYNKGKIIYRNKMDITHIFTLLSVIEDFMIK